MTESILVVDDQQSMCDLLKTDLQLRGFRVRTASNANAALSEIQQADVQVVITDVRMPGQSGIDLCRTIVQQFPQIPVIVMTAFGSVETAVDALRAGAYDFITKPIEMELLAAAIDRALNKSRLQMQLRQLREAAEHRSGFAEIIGESPAIQRVYALLAQVAPTESSVLVTGESGTGKELVARSIHRRSRRANGPFVAVNCSAIPETLLESEFFGHAKGAFTDAKSDRTGLFAKANRGTLFLDELGDLPLPMQAKLLRALEERVVRPVGSDKEQSIDVRLVSATHRNLEAAIEASQFREDLYYRVNVIQIELPPLRQRGTDILLLAQHYLKQFAESNEKPVESIDNAVAEKLLNYPWPGNVRELRNVIERAVALTTQPQIGLNDLPDKVLKHSSKQIVFAGDDPNSLQALSEIEQRYILHVVEVCRNNRTQAAQILGMDRKTLYRKLRQYGVEESEPD